MILFSSTVTYLVKNSIFKLSEVFQVLDNELIKYTICKGYGAFDCVMTLQWVYIYMHIHIIIITRITKTKYVIDLICISL